MTGDLASCSPSCAAAVQHLRCAVAQVHVSMSQTVSCKSRRATLGVHALQDMDFLKYFLLPKYTEGHD